MPYPNKNNDLWLFQKYACDQSSVSKAQKEPWTVETTGLTFLNGGGGEERQNFFSVHWHVKENRK